MSEYIKIGLKVTWLIVVVYWFISGLRAKKVESQERLLKRFVQYWLPLIIAIFLLGPGDWFGHSWLRENFVEHTNFVGSIGLFIAAIGAVIACTSRYTLGKNWSLSVQRKESHQLIQDEFTNGYGTRFTQGCCSFLLVMPSLLATTERLLLF